ncbi:tripartite tricarboxylate transporter substrate binding protein [Neoroseomonas soli]|uniref:Tripartite tricarboxylate transporter substrate binding protein n=1 Tax=Neoroseomonas soli TaxID=1081025 RepID=A0A9X9WWA1_9PROT|nr:tripartite tricarboxylate transporter substrate binding protein [Neoroseomonas soli]MBR0671430.1 tripartite tricarboxylate transporter substrate binding protein [Neoroseomonas soli]
MNDITRRAALGAALATPFVRGAAAQERFPNKPITVLVPFPAGGATDVQMRSLAEAATRAFGQTVLVENRPGAGSTLGAAAVARARPDGYMVAQMTLPALRLPHMQRMPYDVTKDFTPILHLTGYLFTVIVRAESPYRTWQDLVADARRRPGQVRLGNTGANGTPHLTLVDLAERERVEIVHVPFRGEGDMVPALLGGHIEGGAGGSGVGQLVDEGKLRMLNVWSRERSPRWPNVPTLIDLGYAGMSVTSPYGLVAPAGLEPEIRRALHDGFRTALFDPAHVATLRRLDQPLEYLNSEDYARNMLETYAMERQRVERLGLRTG